MTRKRNKESIEVDSDVQHILDVFAEYQRSHPKARVEAKRQNQVSIRIRVIDPDFQGRDRIDREPEVWNLLKTLPDEVFENITMVLLLTPVEVKRSLASMEFDDPIPSRL